MLLKPRESLHILQTLRLELTQFIKWRSLYRNFMLIARAIPYIPSGVLNALGAISKISIRDYVLATLLGKLPSTVVEAMMGRYALTIHTNSLRALFIFVTMVLVYGGVRLYKKNRAKNGSTLPL